MEYFKAEKVTSSTTRITNIDSVYCYLVEGQDRAALIDTGAGVGDLKGYVSSLTDLPLEVILTHGHVDHASGAEPFEQVYLPRKDWELVKVHASMEQKKTYTDFRLREEARSIREEDYCPERTKGYLPLEDGQTWDLGGIILEAISCPGHTQGMTTILNRGERWILLGDACNYKVFLFDRETVCVEGYLENLRRMKIQEGRYDRVFLSHGEPCCEKEILDGVIEVCETVLRRESDDQPFYFMDYQGMVYAKAVGSSQERVDGGLGNIIYNPLKIYKAQASQ